MSDEIDIETARLELLSIQKNRRINELIATNNYVPHKEVNVQDTNVHSKYIFPVPEKKEKKK
jgi:hypothetical protein